MEEVKSIRVLIVEDEPVIAEDIAEHLMDVGYEIEAIAYSKEDALNALAVSSPDIVLLDIHLEDNMDGIEIAEYLHTKCDIPFIFLTSYANRSIIDEVKQSQPMGYVVKPFNKGDLFSSIEIALYNYAQLFKPRNFNLESINKRINSPLTAKEFEILVDLYEGNTNKQMVDKHFVSINTIKTHIQRIYQKMETNSRSSTIAKIRSLLE